MLEGLDRETTDLIAKSNIRILKHKHGISGHLGHLYIARIDPTESKILYLYHPPPAHKEIELEVTFDPPVRDAADVKQRLRAWQDEVKKHYTIPEQPVIDYYSPPPLFPFTAPIVLALSVLFFALFGSGYWADRFRAAIEHYGGKWLLPGAAGFAAFMHFVSEPIFMAILNRRHKTPFGAAWKWVVTVMCLGYPALNEWEECVEYERLRHIYKQTDVGELPPRLQRSKRKQE